ncbi:hypothetical protein, partial [Brevundimonas sp.]|uniref:hypothetical protein n=1 Tax=Brevundimonas sp. TaxID=1871086 RepID=UPI0025C7140A
MLTQNLAGEEGETVFLFSDLQIMRQVIVSANAGEFLKLRGSDPSTVFRRLVAEEQQIEVLSTAESARIGGEATDTTDAPFFLARASSDGRTVLPLA